MQYLVWQSIFHQKKKEESHVVMEIESIQSMN